MVLGFLAVVLVGLGFAAVYFTLTSAALYVFQFAAILPDQPVPWLEYLLQGGAGLACIVGGAAFAAIARTKGAKARLPLSLGQIVALGLLGFCLFRLALAPEHGLVAVIQRDGPKEIADFWLVIASAVAAVLALFLFPIFRKEPG